MRVCAGIFPPEPLDIRCIRNNSFLCSAPGAYSTTSSRTATRRILCAAE